MAYEIVKASKKAMEAGAVVESVSYPFAEVKEGEAFLVPIAEVTEVDLRMAVSRQNRKNEQSRFVIVKHGEPLNVFEVACVEELKVK